MSITAPFVDPQIYLQAGLDDGDEGLKRDCTNAVESAYSNTEIIILTVTLRLTLTMTD